METLVKKESPTTQIINNQTKSQKPQELQLKQEKKRANDLELLSWRREPYL